MTSEIQAVVANLIDPFRVAITAGSDQGVSVGDKVVLWRVVEVTNPTTGENLGTVLVDNLTMQISDVYERFSLATVPSTTGNTFSALLGQRRRISTGKPSESENSVRVRIQDPATIYLSGT